LGKKNNFDPRRLKTESDVQESKKRFDPTVFKKFNNQNNLKMKQHYHKKLGKRKMSGKNIAIKKVKQPHNNNKFSL
jgi:hypothetical protein